MKLRFIILLAVTNIVTANISFAQTFTNTPNDTIQLSGVFEDLQTLSIEQLNTSANNIHLKWKKVSESVPANWEASVCDNSLCNTSLVDSGMMIPVAPTDYGLLLLHVTPYVNYGTATIRYAVWDTANSLLKDTLTYILTVNNTAGISEVIKQNRFGIFPSPANNNINIMSNTPYGFQFSISDVLGKQIIKGVSNNNKAIIPSNNLLNGVYIISFSNENNIIQTNKIIVQH